ncbi:type II secretion system protein GspM [Hyphococcus lacteus]|uniref:Type II secretion system protein GspM n=1 Tax=Hyphococcus lacteus TaxID=3143536 RepID=A0ABV3Z5Y6_9PROT
MTTWWHELSVRERVLILVAACLAALVIVSLGVLRPLDNWHDAALRKEQSARDGYELTLAAAALGGNGDGSSAAGRMQLRQAVITTASNWGVDLTRIGSENAQGQVEVQAAPMNGEALFSWIAQLEKQYGVTVAFADIANGQSGLITAHIIVFEQKS